jgi:toxin ParE1/3/4
VKTILGLEARNDLKRLYRFGKRLWGQAEAQRFSRALRSAIKRLADQPHIGAPRNDIAAGLRMLVYREHSVFYRIQENEGSILMIRVMHGRELTPDT